VVCYFSFQTLQLFLSAFVGSKYSLTNGLTDHDAQLLILNKVQKKEKECHTYIKENLISIL
jgi:hypothetical protein